MEQKITTKDLFAPFQAPTQIFFAPMSTIAEPKEEPEEDFNFHMSSDEEPAKFEEDKVSTQVKPKTVHEIDPDNYYNENTVPIVPELNPTDVLVPIGIINSTMSNKCLVTANESIGILDLDNVIYTEKKVCLGFIEDVLGPIDKPFYSIFYYPKAGGDEVIEKGQTLYCPLKGIKLVAVATLRESKGCDASNVFDEEVSKNEIEFSDDEEERKAKRHKRKRPERSITNDTNDIVSNTQLENDYNKLKAGQHRNVYNQNPTPPPYQPSNPSNYPMHQYPPAMMNNYQDMPPVQGMNTYGQYPPMQYQYPYPQVPNPYYVPYSTQYVFQPPS